jgi:hypothetical protein
MKHCSVNLVIIQLLSVSRVKIVLSNYLIMENVYVWKVITRHLVLAVRSVITLVELANLILAKLWYNVFNVKIFEK